MTQTDTGDSRGPERRMTARAFGNVRQDLFDDAFAYRPLKPLAAGHPIVRRLPEGRIRELAVWTPHGLIVAAAVLVMFVARLETGFGSGLFAFLPVIPVLFTLVRPVGAWWLALAASGITAFFGNRYEGFPWTPSAFFGYLAVLTIVALRSRLSIGLSMWLGTAVYAMVVPAVLSGNDDATAFQMLFLSALVLLAVAVFHVRRDAKEEVAAQQTVTAVERGRRTLLEERTTIARELHDVVAHHMSVVAIQAEAAPYRVENPPPELEQAFATIRENAVIALAELRRVLGVVRAADYEAPDAPQPTLAELDGLLANVREAGLAVDKTVTGSVRTLSQGVELSAYRIVQEALSNALRHAPGSSASVEISYVLGGLGLRIVNTPPRGLVKPSPGSGHGLTGMRERVTMLNGELTAEPLQDGGYEVAAFIPVPAAERDADKHADKPGNKPGERHGEKS
ncbi:histidine kinase [Streptomyces sp. NPDC001780]|uniref:histidine kinase n=1 Tax=Streptomyces hebeiensis TaxID=229486 RepID=UPI003CD0AB2B